MPRRPAEVAAATRTALLEAALAVFAESGYAGASLEEVARRAKVTRGALYHHFADKAELFQAALGDGWAAALAPLWSLLEQKGPALPRLRRFAVGYLTAVERDLRFRRLLQISLFAGERLPELAAGLHQKGEATRAWIDRLAALFTRARRRGEWRGGPPAATAARALVAFLNGVTITWLLAPAAFSPAQQAEPLTEALFSGLAR